MRKDVEALEKGLWSMCFIGSMTASGYVASNFVVRVILQVQDGRPNSTSKHSKSVPGVPHPHRDWECSQASKQRFFGLVFLWYRNLLQPLETETDEGEIVRDADNEAKPHWFGREV